MILTFHRIRDDRTPLDSFDTCPSHSLSVFRHVLEYIRTRWRVIRLGELLDQLPVTQRPLAAITFDDGWRDTYDVALPVLVDYQLPATVFVTTAKLGSRVPFWQQVLGRAFSLAGGGDAAVAGRAAGQIRSTFGLGPHSALSRRCYRSMVQAIKEVKFGPIAEVLETEWAGQFVTPTSDRVFMNENELRTWVEQGNDVGSHTATHPLLPQSDSARLRQELQTSRKQLENLVHRTVDTIAYPNGSYDRRVLQETRLAGYRLGCTTEPQRIDSNVEPLQLPRVEPPWDDPNSARLERSLAGWLRQLDRN